MNIVLPVRLTLARRLQNTRVQLRWFIWVLRSVGVLYLAWCFLSPPYDVGLLALGVFYLLLPELMGVVRHLVARRFGPVYTYTLTDDGIAIRTAISNLQFDWSAVKSVRQTRDSWVIRLPGLGGFRLLTDDFTPGQAEEWQAFLAGRRLVRS
ncbi:YcxB family protein [Kribbella sp. NPDC050281]|uniref:YcxB family protein n=1 Tax=Kribbella sp. NPDC050281 TaxID=3155515 RepID=UPI0033D0EE82